MNLEIQGQNTSTMINMIKAMLNFQKYKSDKEEKPKLTRFIRLI